MSGTTGAEEAEATVRRSDLTPPPAGPSRSAPTTEPPKQPKAPKAPKAPRASRRGGRKGPRIALPTLRTTGPGRPRAAEPASGARVRRRVDGETRTITLPRVQVPSALTDTGARILVLTGSRIRPIADQTRPVWHPVMQVLRWVSPLGWTVLVVGLVAWWLSARYTWVELAMVATGCLVLVLACVLLAIGRSKLLIRAEVEPTRVTVGDPATGRVTVRNTGRRGMLPLLLELPIGRTAARFTLPALGAGRTHEELFVVPTAQRGVVPVGPATTVHGDPLGLVRRTVAWTERTELVVHPRTVGLESLGAGLLRDLEGQVTPDLSMSDLAFHALREYQPGDDRRYVHWRSSAKHGRLLVRQFLDTRRSHLAVIVDTDPDVYAAVDEDVELAISCAASLALRSILDEQDTTVVCHGQTASRTTGPLTLDALARAAVGRLDLYASVGEAAALAPDASIAVLVTGVERPFIQVQRTLDQFEPEVVRVALVVDPDVPVGVRRLGSIVILHVRELSDLRRVLFSGALA
ncbi:DUF58 domain-containing protein [Phycicoccus duodecadis]|uniref:Uncharacterized protein (DUF58 family) n=1 Tax=Phycicoccus duodecadis TaxID=173053 RepID=A0A2N3YM68_9MICO|nr:DUF58 domain-containing protein [Phycicoccus duodecadis]PKW27934.1 uncharacterized protein (DUF58 family) [Phycicoccus duodecadis]